MDEVPKYTLAHQKGVHGNVVLDMRLLAVYPTAVACQLHMSK